MNHLDRHEVLAVLKIAREQSELDWLLFAFQYIHSHRISEVLALTSENFDGGYCTVQRLFAEDHSTPCHSRRAAAERKTCD